MKVYAYKFSGHWVGGTAVIIAPHREAAKQDLERALMQNGLHGRTINADDFVEINPNVPFVYVLSDGDY